MKGFAQTVALEPHPPSLPSALPVCRHCAEFLASEHTPSVGICALYAVQVLAQDKACSQYYQTEVVQPVGNDDEF